MAKRSKSHEDEPEETEVETETEASAPAEPPPGGSGGNTGQHPMHSDDFLSSQDQAGLDKSVGGGKPEEADKPKKGKGNG